MPTFPISGSTSPVRTPAGNGSDHFHLAGGEVVDGADYVQFAVGEVFCQDGLRPLEAPDVVLHVVGDRICEHVAAASLDGFLYAGTECVHDHVDVAGKGFFLLLVLHYGADGSAVAVAENDDEWGIEGGDAILQAGEEVHAHVISSNAGDKEVAGRLVED